MKLVSANLSNGQELKFGDFNVFIGGNGVGKTTLLLELHSRSTSTPRMRYYWVQEPRFDTADLKSDLDLLKSSISKKFENDSSFYYSQAAKNLNGEVDLSDNARFSQGDILQIDKVEKDTFTREVRYRKPFINLSSCDTRLGLPDSVNLAAHNLPAQDVINVLHRDKKLFAEIDKSIYERTGYHLVLLNHVGTNLQLGLSNKDTSPIVDIKKGVQEEYERIEKWKSEKFFKVTEAGHGIRSLLRLLTSLLDPVNQIIMIDEPEMHLYPSQKRWLGKQLVLLAKEQHKQVFLVTHDPMVLQGILDTNITTNIYRVERNNDDAGSVKSCELDRATNANALKNQEQYLQGLFYQRCIVVEGASDRSFYQNMIDDYGDVEDKDLGFVSAGGKGNTKHIADIASKVGLKIAFIYDLDAILFDNQLIDDVYKILGGEEIVTMPIRDLFNTDPAIKAENDDGKRNTLIKQLTKYNDKSGMVSAWSEENCTTFTEVIIKLAKKGIFIVPQGTLESWAPEVEPKVRFAELAPEIVNGDEKLKAQFEKFAMSVLSYLDIKNE